MKRIYTLLRPIFHYALLAKRSNYKFSEKLEVFRILLSMYLKSKFLNNKSEVTQKIFDFKVTAFNYDMLQYLFEEIFVKKEYFFNTSKSSPEIIDCGANIGMAILYFKKLYPNCSIMAFEPNPYVFKLLKKNVSQNNLTKIQLFNIGLSDVNGEIDFFMGEDKVIGTLRGSFINARGGENKICVKSQKLSTFIDTNEFDLIKIDIEGAEIQVIKDLLLEGKISLCNRYLIEYHHRIDGAKSDFSNFLRHFELNKYDYNIKTDFSEIGDFQDILLDIYKDKNIVNKV